MCTLTWRNDEDLEVFFNRDERKTRTRAEPPRQFATKDGTRYLSPIDPDAGGTWMLANEHGVVLCLLNRWHEQKELDYRKSRGKIVSELAATSKIDFLAGSLPPLCPGAKPFDLIALKNHHIAGFSWDGSGLTSFQPQMPLTSSSFLFDAVRKSREETYNESRTLEQFHCSQGHCCSAYTVRMNRPDAQTWSRSRLRITENEILWDYWEEFLNLEKNPTLRQTKLDLL